MTFAILLAGAWAGVRFDPQTERKVLLVFNTSARALTQAVQVETVSPRFATLAGSACGATAAAPGSVTVTLPAFGYAVCAAETN